MSDNPLYYPRVFKIRISHEPPLARVSVSMDSPVVLSHTQLDRVRETWPQIINKYWSYLETNLDENVRWFTEA